LTAAASTYIERESALLSPRIRDAPEIVVHLVQDEEEEQSKEDRPL
jgi:hypothetical protein